MQGDNNQVDDRGLYAAGQPWINKEHIIGRARGYLPYIGMITIILNDFVWCAPAMHVCRRAHCDGGCLPCPALHRLKFLLVGLMGLFVLTSKE